MRLRLENAEQFLTPPGGDQAVHDAIGDEAASEDVSVVGEGHVAVAVGTGDPPAEEQLAQGVRVERKTRRRDERPDRDQECARRLQSRRRSSEGAEAGRTTRTESARRKSACDPDLAARSLDKDSVSERRRRDAESCVEVVEGLSPTRVVRCGQRTPLRCPDDAGRCERTTPFRSRRWFHSTPRVPSSAGRAVETP